MKKENFLYIIPAIIVFFILKPNKRSALQIDTKNSEKPITKMINAVKSGEISVKVMPNKLL